MAKKLTQKQSEIVEHMYCEVGVSMKTLRFTLLKQAIQLMKVQYQDT